MMALQLLPLLQLIIIFYTPSSQSYPNMIYGTKRYGRSNQRLSSYDSYPLIASQRYPVNYYKLYPYSQSFPEEYYYPQETYPIYYPPRNSKYEFYQAVLPYYYQDSAMNRPGYGYYGYNAYNGYNDPAAPPLDWQEEMIQEAEREEREEAQPIGHESYYENDDSSSMDPNVADTNAAFLQNLILSQMYQDSFENEKDNYQNLNRDYEDGYGKFENINEKSIHPSEDENVRELKQLQKENRNRQFRKQNKNSNDIHWSQNNGNKKQRNNRKNKEESKRSDPNDIPDSIKGATVYNDRKPIIKLTTSSAAPSTVKATDEPKRESRGQKEEFQMRPATPVRHPFASPVLAMMTNGDAERKRTPSVYDTIKHMLDMEKSLEKENASVDSEIRPAMRKREGIITPDENLIRQLSVLKKSQ